MLPKHVVKPGDTLQKIAKQYGVSVDELTLTNLLVTSSNQIRVGTMIYLPSTYAYVARPRETLGGIAQKFGFSLQQLQLFNQWLSPNGALDTGEHVWIPRTQFRIHTVSQRETLTVIAQKHRVPLAELIAMNAPLLQGSHQTNPFAIRPGLQLAIPI